LLVKDLGLIPKEVEVTAAVFNTMLYSESLLDPLFKKKVPITVFKNRDKCNKGPLIEQFDEKNLHYVHQDNQGKLKFFGLFHSTLTLLEFDDRLRVVISSSNLNRFDWELRPRSSNHKSYGFKIFIPKNKAMKKANSKHTSRSICCV
jgi:hypothetical protein